MRLASPRLTVGTRLRGLSHRAVSSTRNESPFLCLRVVRCFGILRVFGLSRIVGVVNEHVPAIPMRRGLRIWPAIDLCGGKCVRLVQGDFARRTVFSDDPVEMARRWRDLGARRLHVVDLDAARHGTPVHVDQVQQIVEQVGLPVQLGGGIRDESAVQRWLEAGVARLVIGTRAAVDPAWLRDVSQRYPGRLVLGIDVREGRVARDGWEQVSQWSAEELLEQFADAPLAGIVFTEISRDGLLAGPDWEAIDRLCRRTCHKVIASGGIRSVEDVQRLAQLPVDGCIIGRALYEGRIRWEELSEWDEPEPREPADVGR
ncbi:MAG: hypothetical protein KatS3mg110_0982 [Pirellulaceae bacterium]|nr:MAG: hypothetical protein KatS3mg110_0982 [Pirellulaceae bacterium]